MEVTWEAPRITFWIFWKYFVISYGQLWKACSHQTLRVQFLIKSLAGVEYGNAFEKKEPTNCHVSQEDARQNEETLTQIKSSRRAVQKAMVVEAEKKAAQKRFGKKNPVAAEVTLGVESHGAKSMQITEGTFISNWCFWPFCS